MNLHDLRITLLEGIHPNATLLLKQAGFTKVENISTALEGEELAKVLQQSDIIGIRSRTQLTDSVLRSASHLKAIGCFCIGTNQVNLDTAQELGIPVFNAPYSNTRSVAELVIAEIIMLFRGIAEKSSQVHAGQWPKDAKNSFEARGKTLGIIGYGNIGSQLSILAEALGMRVIYFDVLTKLPLGNAEQVLSLDELLKRADVVSLHVPEIPETKNMITARELYLMKPGSLLINAARGHCIEIDDLAEALRSGHLGGCALDVFPVEPKGSNEALNSPLRGLPNAILTPHIGGSTLEAQANIGSEVADKFQKYITRGDTIGSVNFAELSLPKRDKTHRLLHIHRNKPGILSKINKMFAELEINITAQSLISKGEISYLLLDIDIDSSDKQVALEQLKSIDGTIRARVLY